MKFPFEPISRVMLVSGNFFFGEMKSHMRLHSLLDVLFIETIPVYSWLFRNLTLRQTNPAMKHLFHFSWYENGGFSMAMLLVV